jgi:O-antigen/teichoic acid export membrane protein
MAEREAMVRVESLAAEEVAAIGSRPDDSPGRAAAASVTDGASPESEVGEGSLAARAAWLVAAKGLSFVFAFALPLLLARKMPTAEFGLYKQFTLFAGTALTFLPLGVGVSALYFFGREPERRRQFACNVLLFHLAVAGATALVLGLRPQLLGSLFSAGEMTELAPLVGLVVLLWVGSAFLEFVAVANKEVKLATAFVVATQFSKAAFLLAAALAYGTVRAIVWAAVIHGALQMLLTLGYLASRFGPFWRDFRWAGLRAHLAYALPLGFASMIFQAQLVLDNYFVSHHYGAALYAVYAVGCFQLPLVDLLSESVAAVTIPRASYLQKQGRRAEIIDLVARTVRKLALAYLPLYAFLLVAGREFLLVLFTEKFAASWPVFVVNITLIPLALVASAYDPVMRAYAEHRYFLLRLRLCVLALLAFGLWYATPRYGLLGAIITAVSVNAIERLATALKVKRVLGITRGDLPRFTDLGKTAVAAAAAFAAAFAARSLLPDVRPLYALAACAAAFAPVYLCALLALGVLTPEERGLARRQLARLPRLVARGRAASPTA